MTKLVPIEDLTPEMRAAVLPGTDAFKVYADALEKQYKLKPGVLSAATYKGSDSLGLLAAAAVDKSRNPDEESTPAAPPSRRPNPTAAMAAERKRLMDAQLADMGGFQRFMAGVGKSAADVGRGVGQLLGVTPQSEVDEAARLDAPLLDTGAGFGGNLAGVAALSAIPAAGAAKVAGGLASMAPKVAQTVPALSRATQAVANVAANPYVQAGLAGATYGGAMSPVESGASRGSQALAGGLAGAAGQGVANAVTGLVRPVTENATYAIRKLADKADELGIPIRAADISDSKLLRHVQNVFDYLPFSGTAQAKEASQKAYNRALSRTLGEDSDDIAVALQGARARNSQVYDDLASRNVAELDPTNHGRKLLNAWRKFRRVDTSQDKSVSQSLDDYLANIVDPSHAYLNPKTNNYELSGKMYKEFRSEAGKLARQAKAKGEGPLADFYNTVKATLDDAMRTSSRITPEDKAAYLKADKEWGNLRTLENLAPRDASGDVDFAKLASVLNQKAASNIYNRDAFIYGRHDQTLPELARIGTQFLQRGAPPTNMKPWLDRALHTAPGAIGVPAVGAGLYSMNAGAHDDHPFLTTAAELGGLALTSKALGAGLNSQWFSRGAPAAVQAAQREAIKAGLYRTPLAGLETMLRRGAPPEDVEDARILSER